MAYGLLTGKDPLHLYRHDVESLFYIMLMVATRYEVRDPEAEGGGLHTRRQQDVLPYDPWFERQPYNTLAFAKNDLLTHDLELDLSPGFEDFGDWVEDIHGIFVDGFISKQTHRRSVTQEKRRRNGRSEDKTTPEFDDETLGGHVRYQALIDPARNLKGKLKGLIIRYNPRRPPQKGASKGGKLKPELGTDARGQKR